MNNFECHITLDRDEAHNHLSTIISLAARHHAKNSEINGDPVLGKKPFFYLTFYDASYDGAKERLTYLSDALNDRGINVLREKIEFVIYDKRY
jgi:hypothetical protein